MGSKKKRSFRYGGKRYYVYADTDKELILKMAQKLKELEEDQPTINSDLLVKKWAYKCVDLYKTNQKEITRKKYMQRLEHCVLEHLGNRKLKDVTAIECQEVMNLQIGKSKTQINEVYQQLKFIFGKAYDNELIKKDPSAHLEKPKGYRIPRREITNEEREALYKVCEKDHKFDLFMFMLLCGCRPSEAQNLQGEDISLYKGVPTLHIRGTKTEKSDRYVPLNETLYERYKDVTGYLFMTKEGSLYTTGYAYKRLCHALYRNMDIELGCTMYRNQIIEHKLAEDFKPYNLRHTFASDCCRKKVDLRVCSIMMGHSSIQITNDIYTHVNMDTVMQSADLLK